MPKKNGKYIREEPKEKRKFQITRKFVVSGFDYPFEVTGDNIYDATVKMLEKLHEMGKDASHVLSCELV